MLLALDTQVPTPAVSNAADRTQFMYLMRGMRDERERLKSGIVHIDYRVAESLRGVDATVGEKILYAFDFDSDELRLDRFQGKVGVKYVRNAAFAMVASMNGEAVVNGLLAKTDL